jgi:hypothetical protein
VERASPNTAKVGHAKSGTGSSGLGMRWTASRGASREVSVRSTYNSRRARPKNSLSAAVSKWNIWALANLPSRTSYRASTSESNRSPFGVTPRVQYLTTTSSPLTATTRGSNRRSASVGCSGPQVPSQVFSGSDSSCSSSTFLPLSSPPYGSEGASLNSRSS